LLPAALQGIDIGALLEGARLADVATREHDLSKNPSAWMALMWHWATRGKGAKDLVVLPYKDRLLLLSRYLQQLLMESLGKEKNLAGEIVHQGLTVYGNKGSTDQHAYVQQLRDGVENFFVLFIEVLKDRSTAGLEVEPNITSGDYLLGFLLGTRAALAERGRESMTLTVPEVSARTLGALIALFERAVGLYASLIGINAYHQPGVEAGKKAAASVLSLQLAVLKALDATPRRTTDLATRAGSSDPETVFKVLQHLAANGRVRRRSQSSLVDDEFFLER
jgi:glucose-6-phosphate isomerase